MTKQKKAIEKAPQPRREAPKGREELYFFPNERKTISATSIEEATKKLKEGEK